MFQIPGQSRKRARASLSDLSSLDDIEGLTVRQLKEILARNFVNYSGCCEKWELVEKVSRLYRETEANHRTRKYKAFVLHTLSPMEGLLERRGRSYIPSFKSLEPANAQMQNLFLRQVSIKAVKQGICEHGGSLYTWAIA